MNPRNFISELKKIKLWLENEDKNLDRNYREYIGFYPLALDKEKYRALAKGYWSSFFFARITDKSNITLRIFPDFTFHDWPVLQNTEGEYSYTICNSLSNFAAFNQIRMLLKNKFFDSVSKNWETTNNLLKPLLELFGTTNEMEFIKEYAFDPDNKPATDEDEDNIKKYLEFWFHYDKSNGHKVLRELIDALKEDEDWLPETMPKSDMRIWETRIKIMLMLNAKMTRSLHPKETVDKFIWEGYTQPHGYDSTTIVFSHYPSSNPSESSIWTISDYFNLYKDDFNKTESQRLLSDAADKIVKSFKAYDGKEHYEAALILEQENKPLEAWNALISASYWAGLNGKTELVETSWQKAIELCQSQNWTDALDALTYQWEWYQDYKKENGIS